MRRNKWGISALAAFTAISVTVAGCSEKQEKAPEAQEKQAPSNLNATGMPIAKEKLTLRMVAGKSAVTKNFEDMKFFKDLETKSNIHIDWEPIPDASLKEKINLIFAGGELPDAFYGHYILQNDEVLNYGTQGVLIPLEGLIDKYAPNIKKLFDANPGYKKDLTAPDGHIYSLPTIDESNATAKDALFINKKWLDKLNLQVPTTTEEFYKVLQAFKENDMNGNGKKDEIPFSFRWDSNIQGLYSMFGSFGLTDRYGKAEMLNHIVMKGDKVTYSAVQPEYKEAIQYFHRLFKEGLIDREGFTHDQKMYLAKLKSKENNVGAFVGWSINSTLGTGNDQFVAVPPLKGPKGTQLWAKYQSGILSKGAFAITSVNKHPEATIRWADMMYDPMVSLQASKGVFGLNMKELPDGRIETLEPPQGMSADEFRHKEAPGSKSLFSITKETQAKLVVPESATEKQKLEELYAPFQEKNIFPGVYFNATELDSLVKYFTDIDTYASKMYAKWLLDGGIESEWDAYVKKMNDMGLEKMIAIYQSAYDRYHGKK
ncbi:extracellular solute-binding protein [Paenibacillus silviterrae]|uniref:extracellular solute-binding protein n=1 Tax=Paenibacillus silviterrae TaxID=3242194 RepID=UPI002543EFFC|nr:extracellular solute-binding protein [Paenibacillus chinjuensis]